MKRKTGPLMRTGPGDWKGKDSDFRKLLCEGQVEGGQRNLRPERGEGLRVSWENAGHVNRGRCHPVLPDCKTGVPAELLADSSE